MQTRVTSNLASCCLALQSAGNTSVQHCSPKSFYLEVGDVLGMEPRALHVSEKHSATKLHPQRTRPSLLLSYFAASLERKKTAFIADHVIAACWLLYLRMPFNQSVHLMMQPSLTFSFYR